MLKKMDLFKIHVSHTLVNMILLALIIWETARDISSKTTAFPALKKELKGKSLKTDPLLLLSLFSEISSFINKESSTLLKEPLDYKEDKQLN